jgi:hypothetical protein
MLAQGNDSNSDWPHSTAIRTSTPVKSVMALATSPLQAHSITGSYVAKFGEGNHRTGPASTHWPQASQEPD